MKYGTKLNTDRLIIRSWNLSEIDRTAFHILNSDEQVMQYFPFTRTREVADKVLESLIAAARNNGYGWSAICLKSTGEPIGFAGLSKVNFEAKFTPATEIGWRIMTPHWRKGYALEAATALIQHGFDDLGLEEVVAFAVKDNTASISLMQRLGMQAFPDLDFDTPGISDKQSHLRKHVFYRLSNPV
ncbi:MAG: GNAT family N-acetyltransferase [Hyphomicrobiales bacterium]|nr:GNAT family N-acetyltransferase [Hyphomicrobiales bacterium]